MPTRPSQSLLDQMPALRVGTRLSEQLADALAASIRQGQWRAGEKIPTESALVERFGVSRTVVREALSRLRTLGLIVSRQGSGAFVQDAAQAEDTPPAAGTRRLDEGRDPDGGSAAGARSRIRRPGCGAPQP